MTMPPVLAKTVPDELVVRSLMFIDCVAESCIDTPRKPTAHCICIMLPSTNPVPIVIVTGVVVFAM